MLTFSAGFKKYFANTSWLMGERVLSMAVTMLVGIYVARYLGPTDFGLLNYAISLVALFTPVAKLGLDGIVVREIVKHPEKRREILGTAFVMKMAGALMLLVLVGVLLFFQSTSYKEKIVVLTISASMLLDAFMVYDLYNQASVKMKDSSVASFVSNMFASIYKLLLIYFGAKLVWFAVALVVQKALQVVILRKIYLIFDNVSIWKFDFGLAKGMFVDSYQLLFSSIAVVLYMKIDQVMLNFMQGPKAVGEYSAAVQISEAWYFVPILISQSVLPAIIQAKNISENEYRRCFGKLFILMSVFSYLVMVPIFIYHESIVQFLYGNEYAASGSILYVHVFSLIFVCFGVVSGNWLLIENYNGLSFWRTFAGGVCNVVVNFMVIPEWGGVGAAWATVFSYAFAGYFFDVFVVRMRWIFKCKTYSLLFCKV